MTTVPLPWSTVHCHKYPENSGKFVPRTPWMSASRVQFVKAVFEVAAMMTNGRVKFAYQTADVESAPDTAVAVGGAPTADGIQRVQRTDISSAVANKALIRFEFWAWNSSTDDTLACLAAGGHVEIFEC